MIVGHQTEETLLVDILVLKLLGPVLTNLTGQVMQTIRPGEQWEQVILVRLVI